MLRCRYRYIAVHIYRNIARNAIYSYYTTTSSKERVTKRRNDDNCDEKLGDYHLHGTEQWHAEVGIGALTSLLDGWC